MKSNKIIAILLLLMTVIVPGFSQEKVTLSGTITAANSNETIIGANIVIKEIPAYTSTNEYGFYSITIPKGNYKIEISSIGFQSKEITVDLNKNTKLNVSISENSEELQEVIITEKKTTNTQKAEMSVNKLSITTIKKMPVVLGEVDVLKSLLLLPGVTNAGEGASGFNVRGGGADQNLILLDEATIFNSSHVFGFFSVFNPDAIKDLKLYKGGIPSRFGGRASSVLDVYQKDGNSKSFHANGGIGLISSRLLLEGPIVKDKGSFIVAGRGSYAHLFLKFTDNKNSAYFYDLNTKLNYKLDKNNSLYVSGYFGRDVFNLAGSFTNIYGNATSNLRWNHLFSDKLFSNLSFIYSDYYYGLQLDFVGFKYDSGIKNYNLKYDFKNYISDKVKLNYGVNAIYYDFNPGSISPTTLESGINNRQLDKKYAFEPAIYLEAEQKITDKLEIMYGVRYSQFSIDNNQSIKASYNRMTQYLQLVSNTSSPTPLDVWTPSDNYIKPQIADQIALGYFKNFNEDKYSVEVETFFKTIKNRINYIDGANLIANEALEQVILNGQMRSYGLELLLRKNTGKLNGWISYTLSRSEQQTPGRTANEIGLNNGNWYSSIYDKLHNLAITGNYNWSDKWSFGANFILQTGQPVTFPNGQYQDQGITIPSFGLRNEDRLPAFHHLDISATYIPKPQKKKNWQGEWVFSIYNVYNRQNAASISFRQNNETGANEAVRFSIFGAVPAVSYNFKF